MKWKQNIIRWKKQIICVGAGILLGIVAQLYAGAGMEPGQEYMLKRNGYGQGEAAYRILVEGLEEDTVLLDVNLSERTYTKEEALAVYADVLEHLPEFILGENASLNDVRSSLNLVTSISRYGIRLRWESEDPELVDSFGQVNNTGLSEEGREVGLRVRMTDGKWPAEYVVPVMVKPPLMTDREQRQEAFLKMLQARDEQQNTGAYLELPASFQGRTLRYHMEQEPVFLPVAGLGAVAALLLALKEKQDIQTREARRKQQMLLDYSEVLSRLIIFLGAGMSIRTAWDKIAFDYRQMVEAGRRKPRHVYNEMYETSCQMKGGVSEGTAFAQFGKRCGLQPYIKLAGLLDQNRKNGSRNLRDTLKIEMAEAFEQRKHQARRMGEEAGTKLLVPLCMMLSVVMVMIAVPALMEFG